MKTGRNNPLSPPQASGKENIDLLDVTSEDVIVLGGNQGSEDVGCRSIPWPAENPGIWSFPTKGTGGISAYRGTPDLHSVPEVLLPPGPESLISASLVRAPFFPVSCMLSGLPDVPDEPSAHAAGLPSTG